MTETTVNIPLLRKAVEWAEAEAAKPVRKRQWNQGDYAVQAEDVNRAVECGTCYCIAGYVASLDHEISFSGDGNYLVDGSHLESIADIAQDKLGLSSQERYRLFLGQNSIADVREIAESIAGERL